MDNLYKFFMELLDTSFGGFLPVVIIGICAVLVSRCYFKNCSEDKVGKEKLTDMGKTESSNSNNIKESSTPEDLCLDTAFSAPASISPPFEFVSTINITFDTVSNIESKLDFYELVSLVFLLYDTPYTALQALQTAKINNIGQRESNRTNTVLVEWARYANKPNVGEQIHKKWSHTLLEALTIVQCYKLLRELGFSRPEMEQRYLPLNCETTIYIDRVRKTLYRMAESMTSEKTRLLIDKVEEDLTKNTELYRPTGYYDKEYLEMYFLYWMTISYIQTSNKSKVNLSNLKNIVKEIGMVDWYLKLESCESSVNDQFPLMVEVQDCKGHSPLLKGSSSSMSLKSNAYKMDSKNAGLCLIINQKKFKKSYFIDDQNKDRDGTDADRDKLIRVFEIFGFKCVVEENIPSSDFITRLYETISSKFKKEYCCLVVVILSHGFKDYVLGSDGIEVPLSKVETAIKNSNLKKLLGKPKILIIQACQSPKENPSILSPVYSFELDEENKSGCLTTDDIATAPVDADFLMLYASYDFSAVRHTKHGSWLIDKLCQALENNWEKCHFVDILTLALNEIMDLRYNRHCMVPTIKSTIRKHLYLKPILPLKNK